MRTAEIKFIKFQHMHGRIVAMGQLVAPDGTILVQGSVAQMLQVCTDGPIVISNAQEVLDIMVRKGGFGA